MFKVFLNLKFLLVSSKPGVSTYNFFCILKYLRLSVSLIQTEEILKSKSSSTASNIN